MYTIYCHTNKSNGKKYVGVTSQPIKKRWNNGEGYQHSTYFYNAIKKYGWDNFEHEILCENLPKETAEKLEKDYIALFKTTDSKYGYNIESGGNSLKTLSETTKQKISIANKGRKMLPHQVEKMASYKRGKHLTTEHRLKIARGHSKFYIVQCDENEHIVCKYRTMTEASSKTGLSKSAIYRNINHQTNKKLLNGFIWKKERIDENRVA